MQIKQRGELTEQIPQTQWEEKISPISPTSTPSSLFPLGWAGGPPTLPCARGGPRVVKPQSRGWEKILVGRLGAEQLAPSRAAVGRAELLLCAARLGQRMALGLGPPSISGKGAWSWVPQLPCRGSQSTFIWVCRGCEADITQLQPNDLPEVTQQAVLKRSITPVPVPSVSAPTHSTRAPVAQGSGGGKQHSTCGCVGVHASIPAHAALFQVTSPSGDTPFSFLSVSKQQPECLTRSSGHVFPRSRASLHSLPFGLQEHSEASLACEGLQQWRLGFGGVLARLPPTLRFCSVFYKLISTLLMGWPLYMVSRAEPLATWWGQWRKKK